MQLTDHDPSIPRELTLQAGGSLEAPVRLAREGPAVEEYFGTLYDELRGIARRRLRTWVDPPLQATALVHETFLLLQRRPAPWHDRTSFLSFAAITMTRVLIRHRRRRQTSKRGGAVTHVALGQAVEPRVMPTDERLLDLRKALDALDAADAEAALMVRRRFFKGLTLHEAAAAAEVSRATMKRRWRSTRAWLRSYLRRGTVGHQPRIRRSRRSR